MLALVYLAKVDSLPVFPGIFHLTLVHNTGIAFGFFQSHPAILFMLITASLVVLIAWSAKLNGYSLIHRVAFALILGGAIGNWIDRMRLGAVVDFLDFRIWPVFNLADSAITIGVVIYLITMFRTSK